MTILFSKLYQAKPQVPHPKRTVPGRQYQPTELEKLPLNVAIQFSGDGAETVNMASKKISSQQVPKPKSGFFSKERWTGAYNSLKQDLSSPKWWLKQGAIAGAITLATCWLPGSQLVTIPLWLGFEAVMSACRGHQHYADYQNKNKTESTKSKQWTQEDKRKGAWQGFKQGVKNGFTKDFGQKLLISGAICLATCWLPGSQIILIPALFCTYAAWDGIQGAFQGYENPAAFADKSKKAGKAETK